MISQAVCNGTLSSTEKNSAARKIQTQTASLASQSLIKLISGMNITDL